MSKNTFPEVWATYRVNGLLTIENSTGKLATKFEKIC